jgi:hypothetical protein
VKKLRLPSKAIGSIFLLALKAVLHETTKYSLQLHEQLNYLNCLNPYFALVLELTVAKTWVAAAAAAANLLRLRLSLLKQTRHLQDLTYPHL